MAVKHVFNVRSVLGFTNTINDLHFNKRRYLNLRMLLHKTVDQFRFHPHEDEVFYNLIPLFWWGNIG